MKTLFSILGIVAIVIGTALYNGWMTVDEFRNLVDSSAKQGKNLMKEGVEKGKEVYDNLDKGKLKEEWQKAQNSIKKEVLKNLSGQSIQEIKNKGLSGASDKILNELQNQLNKAENKQTQ